jgi:hypothetical protein
MSSTNSTHHIDGDRGGATITLSRDGGATVAMWSRVEGSVTGDRWRLSASQIAGLEPWQIAAIARDRGTCLRRGIVVR